jgi:hypothetical protein
MSASDYTSIRRLQRTIGNRPYWTEENVLGQAKMENISCIYNDKFSTPGEILHYFDVAPASLGELSSCLSTITQTAETPSPIVKKPRIIQAPLWMKKKSIIRSYCLKRAGFTHPASMLRVCGVAKTTGAVYTDGNCDE